ncbi:hypothetical protein BKA65DRAFT_543018 [Rhexocercosporidium sp. MPI-PUGE-AT-0058]|nr:hypothetical protein BKA65DRAFT_543018 [Rhexocercosporidium sp. MPI-PUGE-AT-0058]
MKLGLQALLLSITLFSSIAAIGHFKRQQCAIPCGLECGLVGDTCCTTPSGVLKLCGYGTICCLHGCCNPGSICQADGSCVVITAITTGGKTVTSTSTVGAAGSSIGIPNTSVLVSTTIAGGSITVSTSFSINVPPTVPPAMTDGQVISSQTSAPQLGTEVAASPSKTVDPSTAISEGLTSTSALTQTLQLPQATAQLPVTSTTLLDVSDISPGPSAPSLGVSTLPPDAVTGTFPDGAVFTSISGHVIWSTNIFSVPAGLSSIQLINTLGQTNTVQSTELPSPEPTGLLPLTATLTDGTVFTSSAGLLFLGGNTLTVPTGLISTQTLTSFGQTFIFLPDQPTDRPGGPVLSGSIALTRTFQDGMVYTSSSDKIYWSTFILPVPTGLSVTGTVTTNSETFAFPPSPNIGEGSRGVTANTISSTASTTVPLITYTTWPFSVSFTPVTTAVLEPKNLDDKPVIPCNAWFFFICIAWKVDLGIFGWQMNLPPGVYPPGPPPGIIFPPGITLPGPLPPWPEIMIGENYVPTYSEEPTSCETESATMFLTTTSFAVSAGKTTATRVLSMSGILEGCDIQDQSSTRTTTSVCPSTATTCSTNFVILTGDPDEPSSTGIPDDNDELAISLRGYSWMLVLLQHWQHPFSQHLGHQVSLNYAIAHPSPNDFADYDLSRQFMYFKYRNIRLCGS